MSVFFFFFYSSRHLPFWWIKLTCADGTASVVSSSSNWDGSDRSRDSSEKGHFEDEKKKRLEKIGKCTIDRVLFIMLDVPRLIYNSESCTAFFFYLIMIRSFMCNARFALQKIKRMEGGFIYTRSLLLSWEIVIWRSRHIVAIHSGTVRIAHGRAC